MAAARAVRGAADPHDRAGRGIEPRGDRRRRGARGGVGLGRAPPQLGRRLRPAGRGRLEELAAHPRVVAIGETGLDYYRDRAPVEDQRARVRRPDRGRPPYRAAAGRPPARPGRRRGGRARPSRRCAPGRGGHGHAPLLLGAARPGRRGRRAGLVLLVRGERHLSEVGRICARRRGWSRPSCSWSRPTRRSWPRSRFAASRTSRPTWSRWPSAWPRSAASPTGSWSDRGGNAAQGLRAGTGLMVRLGQNFLADPNLLEAIVRDAALDPADVVLEIGGGEGVLTERSPSAPPRPRDRDRPGSRRAARAGRGRASERLGVRWDDAMRFDLAALDPAPTSVVSNLPYSIATPAAAAHDRRAARGPRWTVMVQREIGDRLRADARAPRLRGPERARPVRVRGRAASRGGPGGLRATTAGGLRAAAASSGDGPAATEELARLRARGVRPPAKAARRLARAGPPRGRATGCGRPSGSWASAEDARAEALSPAEFAELAARPRGRHEPGSTGAGEAQPRPLRGPAPRRTACTSSARCSARSPWPTGYRSPRPDAPTRWSVPRSRGRTSPRPRWPALRARGWERPPLRVEIEKRIPVAAGLGGGSADAARDPAPCGGRGRGARSVAAALGADVPSQLEPGFALVGGAGEVVEPLPPPGEFGVVLVPAERGLATAAVFAEADLLGIGRDSAELAAAADAFARPRAVERRPLSSPTCSTTT